MNSDLIFQDFLPIMAERLGGQGLIQELAKGFQLLADPATQTITLSSLKRNAPRLGLPPMNDRELRDMIRLGDTGGRGELDLHQFCVAMIRTSPALMEQALENFFQDALFEDADADNMEELEADDASHNPPAIITAGGIYL